MEPQASTPATRASQPAAAAEPAARIEDHALIGDLHTAALVANDGSIDWMCVPAFDADACFAALVGTSENGRWKIAPTIPVKEVRRRYRKDTLILETDFVTAKGILRLVDFMPPRRGDRDFPVLCRSVRCIDGKVPVRSDLAPRFAFGRAVPRVATGVSATSMYAGADALYLRGGPVAGPPALVADFTLAAGQEVSYTLAYAASFSDPTGPQDLAELERSTEDFWTSWCAKLQVPASYRDLLIRSLITLKACIYEPTGGMVAAPTTSLPETPGGERNWDYRFCWLRDSALAMRALVGAGMAAETKAFLEWGLRAIAGDPEQVQIMYGLRGERRLSEVELGWLDGYQGARPVRVGNAAYEQRQLDIYGEVALLIYNSRSLFLEAGRKEAARAMLAMARHVAKVWQVPDRGIWEMRGPERAFTASKVSAWGALDRAIKFAEEAGDPEPIDDLRAARKAIFEEVCSKGWNAELNTFTQYYGGTGLDASLLFIPLSGFLPPNDPRVIGTVAAIERALLQDGLVLRYQPEEGVDGLSGTEGVFLACSFWLVGVYQMMGRTDDARRLFDRLASLANDVGLLAEEYEPNLRRQLGNFPQAFSHFALVNAALALTEGEPMSPSIH